MGSLDTSRTTPDLLSGSSSSPVGHHSRSPSRTAVPLASPSPSVSASLSPLPYERAMAAASGAAAAAAAAATAVSSLFGPCGDAAARFAMGLPPVLPIPPLPPLQPLHRTRCTCGRARYPAPGDESAGDARGEDEAEPRGVMGAYNVQVVVWPDGHVERITRRYEATSSGDVAPAEAPSRPPSRGSSAPLLASVAAAAAAGDAPEDPSVLATKSYQTIPPLKADDATSLNSSVFDEAPTARSRSYDTLTTAASKLTPCWSKAPYEDECDEEDEDGGRTPDSGRPRSTRFSDLEALKKLLRGVFESFRASSAKTMTEDTSGYHPSSEEGSNAGFDSEFLQPSDDEETLRDVEESIQAQDMEENDLPADTEAGDRTEEEEQATVLELQSQTTTPTPSTHSSHTRRPWCTPTIPLLPAPPCCPPPPPPPPPPLAPTPTPSPMQARTAAFATSASPELPPGAVFFETGTFVAEGADPEFVKHVLSLRENAMRAAERAATSACDSFAKYFTNYASYTDEQHQT